MELVRGATLEQQIRTSGPFGAHEAALVGIDLCRALAAIHAAGLIHRDVKAQNVMREGGGRIVLMDLGTGREVGTPSEAVAPDLAGTPLYLAPELFSGARASERTDLYSLGVLLYHLVTGIFPIRATTIQELHEGHTAGRLVRLRDARPDLPSPFVRVVERAIGRDPARRYQTAGEFESALVEWIADASMHAASREAEHGDGSVPSRSSHRRLGTVAAAIAAVLTLAIAGMLIRVRMSQGDGTAGTPGRVSMLAVLPFENLSADPDEAYLATAVPMELTARLGQVAALKVVPWTFMKQFAAPGGRSLKDVATRTGADAVVEGSVQFVPGGPGGGRPANVRVQVYEASTGGLMWSGSFQRSLGDFFALQGEIAREVTSRVHVVLAAREQALVTRSRQVPPQAMEDYLAGRQLQDLELDLQGAIERYLRAIQAAPGFAEAHAALSRCYALDSAYFLRVPSTVALPRALEASNKAIDLDPDLPEAWAARAFARFTLEGNWTAAEADFRRALELGPESVDVLEMYSTFLTDRGRHDEAIDVGRKAEDRAPFSAVTTRHLAWSYYMARDFDNAIRQARRALEIEPGYVTARTVLARALLFRGRSDEGIAELEQAGPGYDAMLAAGYAMAGRRDDAERTIARILAPAYDQQVAAYEVALAYVALHDEERALSWLDKALRENDASWTELSVDPMLDPIRANARFQAMVAQVEQRR
jgi:TolB-like protein